jgi:hypothetical protein
MTRLASEHDQPHIRSPFMAADQHPAFGGKAQEDATILLTGLSSHGDLRSAYLDPPGLISSWKIGIFDKSGGLGSFDRSPFDHNAGAHILPERDQ